MKIIQGTESQSQIHVWRLFVLACWGVISSKFNPHSWWQSRLNGLKKHLCHLSKSSSISLETQPWDHHCTVPITGFIDEYSASVHHGNTTGNDFLQSKSPRTTLCNVFAVLTTINFARFYVCICGQCVCIWKRCLQNVVPFIAATMWSCRTQWVHCVNR